MSAVEALSSAPSAASQSLAQGLYERHSKRILGFCVRRLATREEAEDAVQTTFLYALRALQRGVVPVSETAWLFKIAENVCLATHRSNGRRRAREADEPPELEDRGGEDRELSRDAGRELLKALGTISEHQRQALLLREWRGLSYREISAHLGVSVGAVETLIFRARKGMAKALSSDSGIRGRLAGVFDLGAALNTLKAALGSGATAAKLAAAAAVVTVAALPAGDSPAGPAHRAVASKPAPAAAQAQNEPTAAAWVGQGSRRPVRPGAKGKAHSQAPGSRRSRPARPAGQPAQGSQPAVPTASAQSGPSLSTPSLPAVPDVQVPDPQVRLPTPPSLPSAPALPAVPSVPALPVELPDTGGDLPALPQIP